MTNEIRWPHFAKMFGDLLDKTGVTLYRLDEDTPLRASNLSKIKAGTRRATDDVLRALADYKPLSIGFDTLQSWRVIDEHTSEAIRLAFHQLERKKPSAKK